MIVFQGEIYAIHGAVEALINTLNYTLVHFYVDCQVTIIAVTNMECSSHSISNCKKTLDILTTTCDVIFHWVKAHVGHDLNEQGDTLAK